MNIILSQLKHFSRMLIVQLLRSMGFGNTLISLEMDECQVRRQSRDGFINTEQQQLHETKATSQGTYSSYSREYCIRTKSKTLCSLVFTCSQYVRQKYSPHFAFDLKFHPYKIQVLQQLLPRDFDTHLKMVNTQ